MHQPKNIAEMQLSSRSLDKIDNRPMVMRDGVVIGQGGTELENAIVGMTAAMYKPKHGGYPDYAALPNSETGVEIHDPGPEVTSPIPGSDWSVEAYTLGDAVDANRIAAEIVASDSPRAQGYNYGVGWGSGPKPAIYFDGIKLAIVLDSIQHEAQTRAWRLTTALRNVRLAETETEKRLTIETLAETIANLRTEVDSRELTMRLHIEELSSTMDMIAPPNAKGYVPHMGIHYALQPVRKIVQKIRDCFANTAE